jgi:hypothetical protein
VNVRRHFPAICGIAVVVLLTSVASASAADPLSRYMSVDKDRVELKHGRGMAVFTTRGAIIGSLRRGSLRIVDLPRGRKTASSVSGAERIRQINERTTVYAGRDISFLIEKGWWKARIQGRGIYAGAAVHGTLALVGTAGRYAIRDGAVHHWPETRRVFRLG